MHIFYVWNRLYLYFQFNNDVRILKDSNHWLKYYLFIIFLNKKKHTQNTKIFEISTCIICIIENKDEVPMVVPLETKQTDAKKREGKICWGGSLEGIDCGDEMAEWLSWNLDRPGLRLIRCTDRHVAPKQYGKLISHANFIY